MNDDWSGPSGVHAAALTVLYALSKPLAAALVIARDPMQSLMHRAGWGDDVETNHLVAALHILTVAGLDPEVMVALRALDTTGTPVDTHLALLALGSGASPAEACQWAVTGTWPDLDTLRGLCALRGHEHLLTESAPTA